MRCNLRKLYIRFGLVFASGILRSKTSESKTPGQNIMSESKTPVQNITQNTFEYCGALSSPEDPNDFIFENIAQGPEGYYLSPIPEEFDLRFRARPSRDQGERGTCAAFVASSIKEIQENSDCGFNEWMSPEFIYYHRDNKPTNGMWGRNVFQILQRIGSVPESMYPYRKIDEAMPPPEEDLYEIAAQYRIANFARVTTADGLKRALLEMGPCYLQSPLYSNRPEFWRAKPGEKNNGGHAVTVVGYNKNGFILKNSWGPEWNGDGYIVFPYEEWGLHMECWASVDEKTDPSRRHVRVSSKPDFVPDIQLGVQLPPPLNQSSELKASPVIDTITPLVKKKKKHGCTIM